MFGLVKKMFGTKYDRDVKTYTPLVEQTNDFFQEYNSLSNDALRNKTVEFRSRISEHLSGIDSDIKSIQQEAEDIEDYSQKEELYRELDELIEKRDEHLEEILNDILPEVFAVVKETTRRFNDNEFLQVATLDHDREMAASKSYVTVEGDRTFWKNSWTAAGGDITWNMVHYDVQLIGGMVLHGGKIGEMATGEGKTLGSNTSGIFEWTGRSGCAHYYSQ